MSGLLRAACLIDIFPTFEPLPWVGVGLARAPGLMILGEEVSFLRGPNRDAFVANPTMVLVRDLSGERWDRCDLLVLRRESDQVGVGWAREDLYKEAGKYYGAGVELETSRLAKPKGRWQSRGQIDTLWYKRRGEHEGRYTHRFAFPLPLESTASGEYRLRLGKGCIANERGIVYP